MPATIRLRQAAGPQDDVELGPREGAVGGLVDDRLARRGGDRIDDGEARFAAHEKAAERPDLADLQEAGLDQRGAMRRQVGKVGPVALPRVDDGEAGAPRGRQEASRLGHRRADAAEVVAHGGEVAVIVDEVALHVDEDERGAVGGETAMGEAVRRGSDRERAHRGLLSGQRRLAHRRVARMADASPAAFRRLIDGRGRQRQGGRVETQSPSRGEGWKMGFQRPPLRRDVTPDPKLAVIPLKFRRVRAIGFRTCINFRKRAEAGKWQARGCFRSGPSPCKGEDRRGSGPRASRCELSRAPSLLRRSTEVPDIFVAAQRVVTSILGMLRAAARPPPRPPPFFRGRDSTDTGSFCHLPVGAGRQKQLRTPHAMALPARGGEGRPPRARNRVAPIRSFGISRMSFPYARIASNAAPGWPRPFFRSKMPGASVNQGNGAVFASRRECGTRRRHRCATRSGRSSISWRPATR